MVRPEAGGTVVALNDRLTPGGLVLAGEELIRLDDREQRLVVVEAEAEIRQIAARIAIENGQQTRAKRDLERLPGKLTESQRQLVLRAPQMAQLQAELAAAEAARERALVALSYMVIRAPFDALVIEEQVAIGTMLSAGSAPATLIAAGRFHVVVAVPVSALDWINPKSGQILRLTQPGIWPEGSFREGTVERLTAGLSATGRMAELVVAIDDPLARKPENRGKPRLLLGSFLRAIGEGRVVESAIALDRAYLRDHDTVWVMTPEGRLEMRPVTVAWRGAETVLISAGLAAGEPGDHHAARGRGAGHGDPPRRGRRRGGRGMSPRLRSAGPIAWMARHSVAPNLLMLVLILGGLFMTTRIRQEYLPTTERDTVTVTIALPGATPEEVEQSIILAVEEELRSVQGVDKLLATANEGSARIIAELSTDRDRRLIYNDISQAVDRVTTFPVDAEDPRVALDARRHEVVELHLYGDVDARSLRMAAEHVRNSLLQQAEISQVDLKGSRDLEIHVEISRAALRAYGLTLTAIAATIREAALDRSGGTLETRGGDLLIRLADRRDAAREFALIPLIADRRGNRAAARRRGRGAPRASRTAMWSRPSTTSRRSG